MLEVPNVDGRLHIARKARHHDDWDPPIALYDPYGPGHEIIEGNAVTPAVTAQHLHRVTA